MMNDLYLLALLACPLGMGLMMWLMMRGQHGGRAHSSDQEHEITQLRTEVRQLQDQASKDPNAR